MKYNINLFIKIINFIVQHNDEPELYMKLQGNIYIDFTCYEDFIDAIIIENEYSRLSEMSRLEIENNTKRFSNIVDFLDNLIINGKSLRNRWQEVEYIGDDGLGIDYTQEPEKQFSIINGRIAYKP